MDGLRRPRSALLQVKHRFFLAGAADNATFTTAVGAWFGERVYPQAKAVGAVEWLLYYDGDPWEAAIAATLGDRNPIRDVRAYYQFVALPHPRAPLPETMDVRAVDEALLAEGNLGNLDALREEMCSERATVDEFLAKSLGVCIVRRDPQGSEVVSWCLSEYDHDARVGGPRAAG